MIDQSLVTSGYDVEVLLGSRYLQYLLLLAADIGVIPATFTVGGTTVEVAAPLTADRTYGLDPDVPGLVTGSDDSPFQVEVLTGHPLGADVKVVAVAQALGLQAELDLYFTLDLDTVPADDGGLGVVTARVALVDVDGPVVDIVHSLDPSIDRAAIIAELTPFVNRSLDVGSTGSGGRLEGLALRKHPADAEHDACLGLYADLRLRNSPDTYLPGRGDVTAASNLLPAGEDVVFATRAGLYAALGPDARFRRAERDGSGWSYPVRQHPSDPTSDYIGELLDITVRPPQQDDSTTPDPSQPRVPGGPQPAPPPTQGGYLTLIVHGDYQIDYFPDPDYRLYVYLHAGTDDEGVLTWNSGSDFEAGVLADIVIGVLSLALVPFLGPWSLAVFAGLELVKEGTELYVEEAYIDDRVEEKVDAAVLDLAPNRFTVVRRRWDPFYETHHQVGLRPGQVTINDLGMVMSGPAVLTQAPKVVRGSVLREAVRDVDDTLVGLAYRVADLEDYDALADLAAPAAQRSGLLPPGSAVDPALVGLGVDDAVARAAAGLLERGTPYVVHRVDVDEHTVTWLLLVSVRERSSLVDDLTGAATDAARTRVTTDEGAGIRAAVEAELDAQGIIATPAEVDALVSAGIEARVAEEVQHYTDDQLPADLAAGLDAVATLTLTPDEAGRLQDAGVLVVQDYDLVHVRSTDRRYYRDRYVAELERLPPGHRLVDNLAGKPRFRRTDTGLIRL